MAVAIFFVFCYLFATNNFIYGAFGELSLGQLSWLNSPNSNTAYLFYAFPRQEEENY